MSYKQGYLHLFNRLTDIIQLMENTDPVTEWVDVAGLLRALQAEGEDCISSAK